MNLTTFCIRRPAFTTVISLVMMIIGIMAWVQLPVRWIPNVTPPEVSITTAYPGANANLVEQDITKKIEESLSGINGIDSLVSNSRQGNSQINISFKLGTAMDAAVQDVRSGVERVRGALPREADAPIVMKADPNSSPIMYLIFSHPHYSSRELSDYVTKFVVPSLETIDGVGSVVVFGKHTTALRVAIDPIKMSAAKVTTDEVARLLYDENRQVPSGQIAGTDRNYSIIADASLNSAQEVNDLIVRADHEHIIRLRDIAQASFEARHKESSLRTNGQTAVAIGIIPQTIANPLEVEKSVQSTLGSLKHSLAPGMQAQIIFNQADYIRASIASVYESLFEAIIFVWLVILAFLCSFRATLIPIMTIPVCLISTLALVYFFNFSINTITLMAFVLAIGLVVDDAIVMLENINRYIEHGLSPFAAAIKGAREIIFPIIAMTLTLTAVYTPIAFTSGLLGVLFKEFTFTLAGAVIISGFIALTLTPMMCARLLRPKHAPHRYERWFARQLKRWQHGYQAILRWILAKRAWVVFSLLIIGVIGFSTFKFLPTELAPAEDMNQLNAYISAPHGASYAYTNDYAKRLEAMYHDYPDVESYLSQVGGYKPNHGWQLLKLKPKAERQLSMDALLEKLNASVSTLPGVRVNVFKPQPALAEFAGSDSGDSVGLVLMTSGDYLHLQQVSTTLIDAIKKIPGIINVNNRLKWNAAQFNVTIDRERAADLGVSLATVTDTLSTLFAGREIGKVNDAEVVLQMQESALSDPNIFAQIYTRSRAGHMVPLSQLLHIREISAPESFQHFDRLRADTIFMTLAPGLSIADAIKRLHATLREHLPDDIKYTFSGEAKSFLESNGKAIGTFLLSLIFIYLVLVAQFESFIDPLVILLTVPFAMVGAMLTLKLFGGTLNIYSNIGLITLVGLIAKHGILITDFANRLRVSGKSIEEAVIAAALLRLRPILMTTAAMVLGSLPLAFAFGPGAESRQQIGLVIAGGVLFGTFFSLIVVPVAYTYLAPFKLTAHAAADDDAATDNCLVELS